MAAGGEVEPPHAQGGLRDAHAVRVGPGALGADVHGDLAEVEIRPDARRGGQARLPVDRADHAAGQLPRRAAVQAQVGRQVHEHLVHRVDVDVLRRDKAQVDGVDARAVVQRERHARPRAEEAQRPVRMRGQLPRAVRFARKGLRPRAGQALRVDRAHPLPHLKEPRPPGHALRLERRRDRKADGLVRPLLVRDDQVRVHRVQTPLHALHRSIEGLQVYGGIRPLLHARTSPSQRNIDEHTIPSFASIVPRARRRCNADRTGFPLEIFPSDFQKTGAVPIERLRPVPPLAARGFGRLIGPLAQTLGLQERGCAPFAFAPCRLLNRTRKNGQ